MIELLVDPGLQASLDVAEVDHHAPFIERLRFERDQGPGIMAMQVPALAVIVEQPVPVAETDLLDDAEHGGKRDFNRTESGSGS